MLTRFCGRLRGLLSDQGGDGRRYGAVGCLEDIQLLDGLFIAEGLFNCSSLSSVSAIARSLRSRSVSAPCPDGRRSPLNAENSLARPGLAILTGNDNSVGRVAGGRVSRSSHSSTSPCPPPGSGCLPPRGFASRPIGARRSWHARIDLAAALAPHSNFELGPYINSCDARIALAAALARDER